MFPRNEFRAALARKDMNIETIAKALDISTSTVSRKINGQSDFFRHEIEKISKLLRLSSNEILNIFLLKRLTKTQFGSKIWQKSFLRVWEVI